MKILMILSTLFYLISCESNSKDGKEPTTITDWAGSSTYRIINNSNYGVSIKCYLNADTWYDRCQDGELLPSEYLDLGEYSGGIGGDGPSPDMVFETIDVSLSGEQGGAETKSILAGEWFKKEANGPYIFNITDEYISLHLVK